MFEQKGSLEERIDKLEEDSEKLQDYARRFREASQEESAERVEDFDQLKLANVGWEDVRAYGIDTNARQDGLANAISKISTTEKTLLIPNQQDVTANATVPSTMKLRFERGGSLNISNGKTVTINGQVEAGLFQIFEGSGSVSGLKEAHPEWWYSGSGEYGTAINKALGFSRATLQDGKTYDVVGETVIVPKGSTLAMMGARFIGSALPLIQFGEASDTGITGVLIGNRASIISSATGAGAIIKSGELTTTAIIEIYGFPQILGADAAGSIGIDGSSFYKSYLEVKVGSVETCMLFDGSDSSTYYNTLMTPILRVDVVAGTALKLLGGTGNLNALSVISPFISGGAVGRYGIYADSVGAIDVIGGYIEAFKTDDANARGIYLNDVSSFSVFNTTLDSASTAGNFAIGIYGASSSGITFITPSFAGGWATAAKMFDNPSNNVLTIINDSYTGRTLLSRTEAAMPVSTARTYVESLDINGLIEHTGSVDGDYVAKFSNIHVGGLGFIIDLPNALAGTKWALELDRNTGGRCISLTAGDNGERGIWQGTGSPEGVYVARVGALYLRSDGGTDTTLYIKETGDNTNTGWVAK